MRAGGKPDPYLKVRLSSLTVHYVSKRSGRQKHTLCGKEIPLGMPIFNEWEDWDLDGEVDCYSCLVAILNVPKLKRGWRPRCDHNMSRAKQAFWSKRPKRAIPDISLPPPPRQTDEFRVAMHQLRSFIAAKK